nr:helicase-related protein [Frankia sp. CcI6]
MTEEFTKNRDVQILLATDAAGEGLNLQAAHLMVNYDLPWNPNRIEQRFGRIHRIGQDKVCRLWNLVASNTREGEVFTRLLAKLDQMRQDYGGKVFDVLGEAFTETPLRALLLDAIQYGERPDVKAKMHEVIGASVGDGLKDLLDERALASEHLAEADLQRLRAAMDEARAKRLQPHYVELAFKAAFTRLGGRIARRERGRYEIANVPQHLRSAGRGPIATKYDRATFDLAHCDHGCKVVRWLIEFRPVLRMSCFPSVMLRNAREYPRTVGTVPARHLDPRSGRARRGGPSWR